MFSYYGSKSKIVDYYPPPKHGKIIEPFAGSARYSLKWFDRDITLIDKDENIVNVWRYLQQASEKDILGLPKLTAGLDLRTLTMSDEERLFVGFLVGVGRAKPAFKVSPFAAVHFSGIKRRDKYEKIAEQLYKIRHWTILHGDYTLAPDVLATHFIDPPYQVAGRVHYRYSAKQINFDTLAAWVNTRKGQVIVCENDGANWLPFQPLATLHGANRTSVEAVYLFG